MNTRSRRTVACVDAQRRRARVRSWVRISAARFPGWHLVDLPL